MYALKFSQGKLFYIDQTKLPLRLVYKECKNIRQAYKAIKKLEVRGAPLLGVFGAYALYLSIKDFPSAKKDKFIQLLSQNAAYLKSSRPTAVNLFWAIDSILAAVNKNRKKPVSFLKQVILKKAKDIHRRDQQLCRKIAAYGVKLIKAGDRILTHCNTGFLATSGEGTALAVIYAATKKYRSIEVYADETRPLLQGARLTMWELKQRKINAILISDNSAAFLMAKGMIDKIIVGADRITLCGDTANKIGTYSLALSAKYHRIPFYVAAPQSTFDFNLKKGKDIPIEKRPEEEIKKIKNVYLAPAKAKALNFAFDVTPANLITAFITDAGIIKPPFTSSIKNLQRKHYG